MGCIVIDGAVDAPDTLDKMLGPERFQALRENNGLESDGLLLPAEMVNTDCYIAHEHRSTWTFEMDLRADSDLAWWSRVSNPDLKFCACPLGWLLALVSDDRQAGFFVF